MWPFEKKRTLYVLPKLPPLPDSNPAPPIQIAETIPESDLEFPDLPEPPRPPLDLPDTILPPEKPVEMPDVSNIEIRPIREIKAPEMPFESITLWLSNGMVVKSLDDLSEAVSAMSEATFHYHVNVERNDFANWIQDVIGDKDLAMKLSKVHKRTDFYSLLKSHLATAKKPESSKYVFKDDTKKYAYMGLRGEVTSLDPIMERIGYISASKGRKITREPKESIPDSSVRALNEPNTAHPQPAQRAEARKEFTPMPMSADYSRRAISQLDSMQEPEVLVARLQPKGRMLAELLRQKRERQPVQHDHALITVPEHIISSAISNAQQTPQSLPKLATAKAAKKPRAQIDSEQQQNLITTLEQAKQKAEESDVENAKKLLAQAKTIIKNYFNGNRKPYQYYIWDAENSLKRAMFS
ncbi:MAG: hypothetical protein EPN86_01885 [Nanoarchaeota archaeon]|nr:MAG: hypothetical protein EPN86_01885 [Nanoarchaeota archaeon]